MRLFIAIPLPSAQREIIAQTQQQVQAQIPNRAVRWVAPENVHLTLQFMGEVEAERVSDIEAALRARCAEFAPLELQLNGAGCFPEARRPRVIWLGLQGDVESLQRLQKSIAQAVAPFHNQHDDKPFAPHLTLGRVKTFDRREAQAIGRAVANAKVEAGQSWMVQSVELIRSELTPRGPIYTTLAKVELPEK